MSHDPLPYDPSPYGEKETSHTPHISWTQLANFTQMQHAWKRLWFKHCFLVVLSAVLVAYFLNITHFV